MLKPTHEQIQHFLSKFLPCLPRGPVTKEDIADAILQADMSWFIKADAGGSLIPVTDVEDDGA